MNRNLTGMYFRLKRNDKYENIDFTDLSEEEMKNVIQRFDKDALIRMCVILGMKIKYIGNQLDLVMEHER